MSNGYEGYLQDSPLYDPVALLQRGDETLVVARVGQKASRRFMILTPSGEPAWRHEPLAGLSDVSWSLRAHAWHEVVPEHTGLNPRPARTLARLLTERA